MDQATADDATLLSPQLPRLWVGYLVAAALFLGAVVEVYRNPEIVQLPSYLVIVGLAGWIYWLYCVYKFHDVLTQVPGWDHPISPGRAVGLHFVPIYNFYWVFKWPAEIAGFVNWRTQSTAMSEWLAGALMLVSVLVAQVAGAIGLALIFSVGVYLSRRLRDAFATPPPPEELSPELARRGPLGL